MSTVYLKIWSQYGTTHTTCLVQTTSIIKQNHKHIRIMMVLSPYIYLTNPKYIYRQNKQQLKQTIPSQNRNIWSKYASTRTFITEDMIPLQSRLNSICLYTNIGEDNDECFLSTVVYNLNIKTRSSMRAQTSSM